MKDLKLSDYLAQKMEFEVMLGRIDRQYAEEVFCLALPRYISKEEWQNYFVSWLENVSEFNFRLSGKILVPQSTLDTGSLLTFHVPGGLESGIPPEVLIVSAELDNWWVQIEAGMYLLGEKEIIFINTWKFPFSPI